MPNASPTHLPTTADSYGLTTERLQITGTAGNDLPWGGTRVTVVPEGAEARQTFGGPMVPGPWNYTTTSAVVIDNSGHSAAEYASRRRIAEGAPVTVAGLPGVWCFAKRDARKLEGDGFKLVPYTEPVAMVRRDTVRVGDVVRSSHGYLLLITAIDDSATVRSDERVIGFAGHLHADPERGIRTERYPAAGLIELVSTAADGAAERRLALLTEAWPALIALESHYVRAGAADSASELASLVRRIGAEMLGQVASPE